MSTPSDPERGASEIDLSKQGHGESDAAHEPEAPFDPYRFGKPDVPVPPEFAPPGYVPNPVPAPSTYPGPEPQSGRSPYTPPTSPYPYGAPPYGQSPSGSPYGQYGYGAPAPGYGPPPQTGGNGKAVTALVSGIASIVLCWLSFLDIIPVTLAVVFGFLALAEAKRRNGAGKGKAIAGLICAAIGAILAIVLSVVILRAYSHCGGLGSANDPGFNQCVQNQL